MSKLQSIQSICNAYIALCLLPFQKKRTNIWLIGGHNGQLYTDNSKVFYEYILKYHPEINIFWVINKKAPAYARISGKKIIKGSIQNYLYFYQSDVSLFSDTFNSDIAPFSYILPAIRHIYFKRFKVFLNHGTIAFKKAPTFSFPIQYIKNKIYQSYNLAIASTPLEKNAMVDFGILEQNIQLLGSPRYDALHSIKTPKQSILIVPTWRPWLYEHHTLKDTTFFTQYKALLSNINLLLLLEEYDITIHFYLHHMFHKFQNEFISLAQNRVKILPLDVDLSYEIRSAKLLITDYSSICSDFYYLKKPVLFFQFDKEEYMKHVESYIDLEKDIFGEVSNNIEIIIKLVEDSINKKYIISKIQEEGKHFFIHKIDKNNSQRLFLFIKNV